jgi:serine-type D-Ala-D-Ala carboxypeptidase/endopeptidase
LQKRCGAAVEEGSSVGIAAAIIQGTNASLGFFGKTALHGGRVDPGTFFELGSISKTFTGIALARGVERGEVRLDQSLQELLPRNLRLPSPAQGITLGQLTTHSSGLPRLPDVKSYFGAACMVLFGADPYSFVTDAQFWNAVKSTPLVFPPGSKSEYSNFGVGLLGYVLSCRAGTNYDGFVRGQVCYPLGMRETGVRLSRSEQRRLAQGYRFTRKVGPFMVALRSAPWNLADYFAAAGGVKSTGTDTLKYLEANMHPAGTSISAALEASHRELFREDQHSAFGMNWIRSNWDWSPQPIIWHNGGTGGFRTFLGFTEDGKSGVFVLCNTALGDVSDRVGVAILKDLARSVP